MKIKNEDTIEEMFDEEEFWSSAMGLDQPNSDIKTTCLSCGFTEKVPDFIYDEMSRKKYHLKIKKKVSTLACQKCFKETAISSYWLEK